MYVDPTFETVHARAHGWVGGAMADTEDSPFDPIFYLHHAFIDMIWDVQRKIVYEKYGKEGYVYPDIDDDEAFGVGERLEKAEDSYHYSLRKMLPFDILNQESVDDKYMATYYYDERPKCSASDQDCGSPYLFCIQGIYKCAPKLTLGAQCSKFGSSDCCYNGKCVDGICKKN